MSEQQATTSNGGLTSEQMAGYAAASGIMSAFSAYSSARVKASAYRIQEITEQTNRQIRELQSDTRRRQNVVRLNQAKNIARMNNNNLMMNYNKTLRSNAVMFSTQGRSFSSGSIQNILRQDRQNYEWDKKFLELSSEYQESSILSDSVIAKEVDMSRGFASAANMAMFKGRSDFATGLIRTAIDYKSVK